MSPLRRLLLTLAPLALLAACASSQNATVPLKVNVASVERIEGAAMELRFNAQLRVQNVTDSPMSFGGAFVELQLNGKTIGTGVTSADARVPRLSEMFVTVPVTVSDLGEVRRAIGLYGAPNRKLDVVLKGKLAGPGYQDTPFEWRGELAMPLPAGS